MVMVHTPCIISHRQSGRSRQIRDTSIRARFHILRPSKGDARRNRKPDDIQKDLRWKGIGRSFSLCKTLYPRHVEMVVALQSRDQWSVCWNSTTFK